MAAAYWRPVYSHIRLTRQLQPADAEDLTQGFFAEALRRDLFARYDPERARFRTYLRTCVDSYVNNVLASARRQKRGGGSLMLSLEASGVEQSLTNASAAGADADTVFQREWVRAVITLALARLRSAYESNGRATRLILFECYDIAPSQGEARPTYSELALRFAIPATQVTNWLAGARRDFRRAVIDVLRDLSASDEELREEARCLLGIELSP